MTRKRLLLGGIFFVALLGAAYGGYQVLHARDLSGAWWGVTSEGREEGRVEWMANIGLWKEDGLWRGSFLFRDQYEKWPSCAGGLQYRGQYGGEYVFREHPSTCGEEGTLHVKRTGSEMWVRRRSPGTREGGGGRLRRTVRPDLALFRVRGTEPIIRMGQTVQGELASPDSWSLSYGWIDTYRYLGEPGEPVVLVLRSDEFEPNLLWRANRGGDWFEPVDTGLVSRPSPKELRVMVEPGGGGLHHGITILPSRTPSEPWKESTPTYGTYTLSMEPAAGHIGWVEPPGLQVVRAGEPVQGALREADQTAKGHKLVFYEDYLYRGRAGEELTVEASSDSLNLFVQIGRMRPGGLFVPLAQDGDVAALAGDAVATLTLPEDGAYVLRTSVSWQGQGPFTLKVTRR
ncbi:hypothetical protein [Longimicrobium sp.]|uniref:hypothetical protein n=1 Tax=Longimicrobium sp. TaxID=2029185 RepID=UPI003B3A8E8D